MSRKTFASTFHSESVMAVERTASTYDVNKIMRALERGKVAVGIPAGSTGEDAEGREIDYATLGYLFENGSPETNMPARPWLYPGVESVKDQIQAAFLAGAKKLLAGGSVADYQLTLHKVGLIAQSAIQVRITQGIAPELSARTVYARLHRKKNRRSPGKMTPLIDTGGFLKSITYIVKT